MDQSWGVGCRLQTGAVSKFVLERLVELALKDPSLHIKTMLLFPCNAINTSRTMSSSFMYRCML
jgi:hypothetical protein